LGERTARYAIVVDHGKVIYAEKEPGRDVTVSSLDIEGQLALTFANIKVSGAEAVIAKL
jgi:peroxiredoxin